MHGDGDNDNGISSITTGEICEINIDIWLLNIKRYKYNNFSNQTEYFKLL